MKKDKLKNIVFLKEVNSNIVDEAIIILKPNIKCEEYIVQGEKSFTRTNDNSNYVISEANMVVSNYIAKIKNNEGKQLIKSNKKLKKMRVINISLLILLVISISLRIL